MCGQQRATGEGVLAVIGDKPKVVEVGEFKGPPPYYGNPKVKGALRGADGRT